MTKQTRPPRKRTNAVQGKQQMNIYVTPETRALFERVLERDGVPFSAQVERAIKLWAAQKGIEDDYAADRADPGGGRRPVPGPGGAGRV